MQVEQEFGHDTMSGTVILLRNNESFFEYDKVIISVGALLNPIKPEECEINNILF